MCGIFGYIGTKTKAINLVVDGLKLLDYRGYDSAGYVALTEGEFVFGKKVGKVTELEESLAKLIPPSTVAIAHTRWATHGKPTEINAHPHFDNKKTLTVVHNGIIENHDAIREMLQKKGVLFSSETDSEVIPQLIGYYYKGDLLKAVQKAMTKLKGAFAIAVMHKNHPEEILCVARECPLAIGIGNEEMFISSDTHAFLNHTKKVIYLHSSEIAVVKKGLIEAFDANAMPITKESEELDIDVEKISKGQFPHYMLKEIYEQPQSVLNALLSRYSNEYGTALLDELNMSDEELYKIQRIVILGCGTSYHAGLLGSYMLEERARIPVQVEISSEFRYKNPIIQENTLAIAISQSGETADTLAAMRELREKGAKVIGICNVQGSTLAREAHACLFLRAGPEIGVASTKAFTSMLVMLALVTLRLSRMHTMSQKQGKDFIQALIRIPGQIRSILDHADIIEKIAKKYASFENFFFLGRRFMFPTALEGALKLKEIAYVNANGYPAGEMKHGPIALINDQCLTVAFCSDSVTYPKILSNLMETKARNGKIIAIASESSRELFSVADDILLVPPTIDELAPLPATVVGQLFAYFIAKERGCEIDKPRNLAKSVTVE